MHAVTITSGPPRAPPPRRGPHVMAVSSRCSGGGVCQPLATLGYDGHAVNDTILAYGQLLVDDPERIGPIQATGMDQTLFNREYPHPAVGDHIRLPLKSEGPRNGPLAVCHRRL